MFDDGDAAIERILTLVSKVPKELQPKCFEIFLAGYVQASLGSTANQMPAVGQANQATLLPPATLQSETAIPPAVLPRFKTTAKRIGAALDGLEALFDFSIDPFGLHPVTAPGKNNAEKTRTVALLAAARSYLATGSWIADRQEVKALCVDQNCYDQGNFAVALKNGEGSIFKSVELGKPIELSSAGMKEAEKLLATLAGGSSATS